MFEPLALIIGSSILVGYHVYVGAEMLRADYYSHGQKIAQTVILLILPLVGGIIVHWFLRLHRTAPDAPDRGFIPQREPDADIYRPRRVDNDET